MSTTISKLYLKGEEFIPISAAEAVMVNGDFAKGFGNGEITTLDKVLKQIRLGIGGTAQTVEEILKAFNSLSAGEGIDISTVEDESGNPKIVISSTIRTNLFRVVATLPEPEKKLENYVYIVLADDTNEKGNNCDEYVCVKSSGGKWVWERFGSISIENSITSSISELTNKIQNIEVSGVTAVAITLSDGLTPVAIGYDIPNTLYDEYKTTLS